MLDSPHSFPSVCLMQEAHEARHVTCRGIVMPLLCLPFLNLAKRCPTKHATAPATIVVHTVSHLNLHGPLSHPPRPPTSAFPRLLRTYVPIAQTLTINPTHKNSTASLPSSQVLRSHTLHHPALNEPSFLPTLSYQFTGHISTRPLQQIRS